MDRRSFIHRSLGAGLAMTASLSAAAPSREEFEAEQARKRKELWGLLGDLPEPRARSVGCHLETCPDCEAAARRLGTSLRTYRRRVAELMAALDTGQGG